MSSRTMPCAEAVQEIWAAWPDVEAVPASAREHVAGCRACAGELESFRALCARGSSADGRPLSWSRLLPSDRRRRLAASTRRAISPVRVRPVVWVPALAGALAALLLLTRTSPQEQEPPLPSGAIEAVENLDMLRHLDMYEHPDLADKLAARPAGGAR